MKLAYIILAYKDVEQVSRLISKLRTEGATFVIHVCKNASKNYISDLKNLQNNASDLYFCKREVGIHFYWGLVKGTLNALKLLIDSKIDFDYVSLISGQDYPLKCNEEIKQFFALNKGKEFLTSWPLNPEKDTKYYENHPWGDERQLYRIDRFHIRFGGKVNSIPEIDSRRLIAHTTLKTVRLFLFNSKKYLKEKRFKNEFLLLFYSRILPRKRELPQTFSVYGGSTWWTISKDFVEYIIAENKRNNKINKFFKYSLIPDEMYFQTHLMNSKFKNACFDDNLREIIWDKSGTHPIIYDESHYEHLTSSTNIFARKFDFLSSEKLMNKLDNYLTLNK